MFRFKRALIAMLVLAACALASPGLACAEDMIAFTAADEGTLNVAVVKLDGSGVTGLTDDNASLTPAWSPDGQRIAYLRLTEPYYGETREVWTMAADGSDKRRIVEWPLELSDTVLSWSPDERYLAFSDYDPATEVSRVIRYELETGSWASVWTDQYFAGPIDVDWSPDGTELAVTRASGDTTFCDIVDMNGSIRTRPLEGGADPRSVSWSRATGALAYGLWSPWNPSDPTARLGISQSADGPMTQVLSAAQVLGVSWDPIGERIVFDGILTGTDSGIFVVNADGSGLRRVIDDRRNQTFAYAHTSPEWRPTVSTIDAIPVAGGSRYETAVEASKLAFPAGADTVVIATGRNWPDALGGSALAGALEAPILLVNTDSVPDVVRSEISRLGATKAVVIGGRAAVGAPVETALQSAGLSIERVWGTDRYLTADAVARRVIALLGAGYDGTAFVATGGAYADAVAAGPLAAAKGWPLYLAHPTGGLRQPTLSAMAGVTDALVLGGPAAVSQATEATLNSRLGATNVTRLAGESRYGTAAVVAEYGVTHADLAWDRVGIATGQAYPDALAGGVLQGKVGSVMLLTRNSSISPETAETLLEHKAAIGTVTYFGGDLAVSAEVREAVAQALE